MESVIRCPLGSPKLTSIPLRTMNGFFADALVSISGTSACQPLRSLPLKRLTVLYCWDLHERLNVISIAAMILNRIVIFLPVIKLMMDSDFSFNSTLLKAYWVCRTILLGNGTVMIFDKIN